MHILDSYALNCGLKINKPFIYEKYSPISHDKYIVLDILDKADAKTYFYWQEVLFLIEEYLKEKSIKIIQLADKNETPLADTVFMQDLSINQKAFIIKNSLLYLGVDSACMHIASSYDKPIVAIYSNSNPKNTGPFFNFKSKVSIIESPKLKPSFADVENPKTVNQIKPEEIAKAILNQLDIPHKISRKTLYTGNGFHASVAEMVPDNLVDVRSLNIPYINIRMDYYFNEQILEEQLKLFKCAILTDKPINLNIYKKYGSNILKTYFIINKSTDFKYLETLYNSNVDFQMVSFEDQEIVNKFKIHTLDYGIIAEVPRSKDIAIINDLKKYKNLKFRSNKLVLARGKAYPSFYHYKKDISYFNNNLEIKDFIYDDDDFANDLEYYSIFEA